MAEINFNDDHRKVYFAETYESLDALLNDALEGDDQNEIKTAFPPNCTRKDVVMDNSKVSLNYINDESEPTIEVVIQISYKDTVIGEYTSVYSPSGELVDEAFYIE